MSAKPYIYEPLSGSDQIRLLHLEPGTGDICFALRPVSLADEPRYEAISYCWGDPTDTRVVYCEGLELHVTASLHAALARLRRPGEPPRCLWADAVCIDQKNIPEKNAQVQLMRRIYSQPSSVLVWLGDDTTGLEGLEECLKGASEVLPPETLDFETLYENSRKIFLEASDLRKAGKPNFNDHNWTPMNNLLCRLWFNRRWIIQEAALAHPSVPRLAICGDMEFSWNDFACIAYRLGSYGVAPLVAGLSVINANAPYMLSFLQDQGKPLIMLTNAFMVHLLKSYRPLGSLVDCVMATPFFQCFDAKDHLYSLLSLAPTTIKADYALSDTDVCMLFATTTLVTDRNLRVLSLAPSTALPLPGEVLAPTRLDIPTWVPDLTCQGPVNPFVSYTIRPQLFHAGGDDTSAIRISAGGRALHLRGRIVDAIKGMAPCAVDVPYPTADEIAPKTGFHSMVKARQRNWTRACLDLAARAAMEAAGGAVGMEEVMGDGGFREAVHETLLCGMVGMRDPIPPDVMAAMPVYLDYVRDYFEPDFKLTDEIRVTMLTYGGLIEQSFLGMAEARCFCTTERGRLGQVRREARVGDVFCVIDGAEIPYVLRPHPDKEGVYHLIGDAFLRGVMQGEALADERFETVDVVIE
ncbi:heterokaryon incompatibility protein-domain-containing protein [Lasiosphaeria hispida]|uniref:Heterokaryon incompatibility protein-domain-containing protein n=1 Tax=Lasiosphaeria hispida TaxID=260671 RepID=A0AAJ0MC59_9PEZI|nr:heterokaryon incompatibility protein-domain-containing protein [Lasiosphaeria hispida]